MRQINQCVPNINQSTFTHVDVVFVSLLTVNTHTSAPLKLVLHLFLLGLSWVLNVSTRTDCCRFLWFDLAPLLHAVNVWHFARVKILAPVYLSKTKQLQDKTHLYTAVESLIIVCFISSLHLEGVWQYSKTGLRVNSHVVAENKIRTSTC